MKQHYYFFQPDKHRNENKKTGHIGYNLKAWFSVPGDLSENPFKELDSVHFWYNSFSPEDFVFEVSTGIDSSCVHFGKNEKEFLNQLHKDGYKLISERDYLRYRKFAVSSFIKYSNPGDIEGEEKYYYSNSSSRNFNEALLTRIRYMKDYYPFNIHNDRIQTNYVFDFKVVETNKIFLSRADEYLCNNFQSLALRNMLFYKTLDEAVKSSFNRGDYPIEISYNQYTRLRKILMAKMVKKSKLEIIKFVKPQDYYNRHS